MKSTTLILAAHPDDEILGCGGYLSKFHTKEDIIVYILGEGSSCRFEKIESSGVQSAITERKYMALEALSLFDIKQIIFGDLPCGRFDTVPILEINKMIEEIIDKYRPDALFTHSCNDVNNDHKIVYQSTIMSTRPVPNLSIKSIYSYEVLSSSEWNLSNTFTPNTFLELTVDDVNKKFNALNCYSSEVRPYPFPRSMAAIKALSMYRGMQSGVPYAEAYSLVRHALK